MNVFPLRLWSQRNGKTKKRVISGKKIGLTLTLRWNGELDMRDWQQQQRITGPHVSYVVSCAVPRVTRDYGFSAGMWFLEWLGKCIALSLCSDYNDIYLWLRNAHLTAAAWFLGAGFWSSRATSKSCMQRRTSLGWGGMDWNHRASPCPFHIHTGSLKKKYYYEYIAFCRISHH